MNEEPVGTAAQAQAAQLNARSTTPAFNQSFGK